MKISRNPLRIVSRFHILPECSAHKYHFVVNSGYMLIFMASSENVCILKTLSTIMLYFLMYAKLKSYSRSKYLS